MKLSVIVPAYNEAKRIESCLGHLASSLRGNARPRLESEIVVVDNNSTDATAELARRMGIRVIFEPVKQISRARSAGATVASCDWRFFVYADTLVSAATLAEILALIEAGPGGRRRAADQFGLEVWNLGFSPPRATTAHGRHFFNGIERVRIRPWSELKAVRASRALAA